MPHSDPLTLSPHCNQLVKYGTWYAENSSDRYDKRPLWAHLPLKPLKRARNDVWKATRRGYRTERITGRTGSIIGPVREILASRPERQGRPVNWENNRPNGTLWNLAKLPWAVYDYNVYTCRDHQLQLYVARDLTQKIVGVCEIGIFGDTAIVLFFLIHAANQKDGVANMLMFHASLAASAHGCTTFSYGWEKHRDTPTWKFEEGLGITNIGLTLADIKEVSRA
jgi:hypothetical protein